MRYVVAIVEIKGGGRSKL